MVGLGLCLGECSGPWTLVGLVVIVDGGGVMVMIVNQIG